MNKATQNTIKDVVEISGIGLHTGEMVKAIFKPAPPDTGIVFIKDNIQIEAFLSYLSSSYRGISLKKDGVCIRTIEHLLAALSSLSITNLFIELTGSEIPIMDGSSLPFIEAIKKVGIKPQDRKVRYVAISSPLEIKEDGRFISILPYNGLKVSYTICFDHPVVQSQSLEITLNEETFIKEIAKARTFGFMDEVSSLRKKGLIKGGSLLNAVVIEKDKILNPEPLRYPDEFVRHKILDLLGDISLLKWRLKGNIIANCSGHSLNIKLVRRINEMIEKREGVILEEVMDIKGILDVIPHRYPFLLVDRILEIEEGKRVVGIKNVTMNENFFQGHFPKNPVMPGVLIIEAMAQVAGILLLAKEEDKGRLVYLAGLDSVRFRKPVVPGDQIRFEVVPVKIRKKVGVVEAKAYVNKELVAEAVLFFSF